ncbi:MAG: DUF1846 domain-containing protein [Ruminococcaceae bacterium]|nr:DUF1846 domain-containing protein [Oscillospiraceae bacterium]
MYRQGFDNDLYIATQSKHILSRIEQFGGKLYLEFGGKLFDDYHASRVLPGFAPDSKIRMLIQMKEQAEIVIVINANDIEKNKVRGDLGITYDLDVLRMIDAFRSFDLYVGSVVLTRWQEQPAACKFRKRLEALGLKVYCHYSIPGYPSDLARIVSDEGYGRNEYIQTSRSLVVITAPGPGSGKMATCLSQLYHEQKKGIHAGYAKFETFPVWNLPLNHPVNLAYEAATVDLNDVNMIDHYHLERYGITAVNYNRDIEIYPVLNAMFERISGESPYHSPTDMGVNMAGNCIIDDEAVRAAANMEIIRRYYHAICEHRKNGEVGEFHDVEKLKLIMQSAGLDPSYRQVATVANQKAQVTGKPAAAIELPCGSIVTGKTSDLLGAASAVLLNALKSMAGIDDEIDLISPDILVPITNLKVNALGSKNPRLHPNELLIALSICAVNDPVAAKAQAQLSKLRNCEMHSSVILLENDVHTLKRLGLNLTCEPTYESKRLYQG